jgi:hypothetical protein
MKKIYMKLTLIAFKLSPLVFMVACGALDTKHEYVTGTYGALYDNEDDAYYLDAGVIVTVEALVRVFSAARREEVETAVIDTLIEFVDDMGPYEGTYTNGIIKLHRVPNQCVGHSALAHTLAHRVRGRIEGDTDQQHTDTRLFYEHCETIDCTQATVSLAVGVICND